MLARFFAPVHIGRVAGVRAFNTATADFINYGPDGALVTSKVSIRTGDLGEAYVMIPPKVGRALQAGSLLTNDSALTNGSAKSALSYFHDTQHFTHELSPGYPRLVIPQQLPHQSASNMSPATLFLYGKLYTIALNGTLDAEFAELASTIGLDLGPALEKLKDM